MNDATTSVVCIGAGPAGLTAAYLLSKAGVSVTVIEKDPLNVGGISKTVSHQGFSFDIGGHRFFSKSTEIENLWTEILGDDFLERARKSRIYYRGQLFDYPIRAFDALGKLGVIEATRCVLSYCNARIFPQTKALTFEQWVTNRFGRRLFEIFFKTYTEKVWGMSCSEISADWAAQRIKGLSLAKALQSAILPRRVGRSRDKVVKTLITSFRYPRRGPGMLWEAAADRIRENGGDILLGHTVTSLNLDSGDRAPRWSLAVNGPDGAQRRIRSDHIVSSMPLRELIGAVSPAPRLEVASAAQGLRYRDFLTVALIVKDRNVFDDNWIYIHDPEVKVGRIQNFKSWSPEMVPDPSLTCYGLEYFCFEGDGLWTASDRELICLAGDELVKLKLASREDIVDGVVVRQPKAYPVYDDGYQERVSIIREEIESTYPMLHLVGRNGMHKYDNQDHAMMTAILTVKNILAGHKVFDVWCVNQDAEYQEQVEAGESLPDLSTTALASERLVPMRI